MRNLFLASLTSADYPNQNVNEELPPEFLWNGYLVRQHFIRQNCDKPWHRHRGAGQDIWQHFTPNFPSLSGSLLRATSVLLHGKNMQSCQAAADLPKKRLPSIVNCIHPVHFWTSLGKITLELLLGNLVDQQRTDSISLENQNKTHKTPPKNIQIKSFFNSHKLHLMSVGQNDLA